MADNNGEMDYDSAVDNGKRQEQAMDDAMMLAFICLAGNVGIVSGIPPLKTRDTRTCRATCRRVGADMLATSSLVGSSDAMSMSCRHDSYPTCRRHDGVWGGVLGGH